MCKCLHDRDYIGNWRTQHHYTYKMLALSQMDPLGIDQWVKTWPNMGKRVDPLLLLLEWERGRSIEIRRTRRCWPCRSCGWVRWRHRCGGTARCSGCGTSVTSAPILIRPKVVGGFDGHDESFCACPQPPPMLLYGAVGRGPQPWVSTILPLDQPNTPLDLTLHTNYLYSIPS